MNRSILPTIFLLIGLALLVGCLYIPTFEHPVTNSQVDFRKMVGKDNSKYPIQLFRSTRAQIIALLGTPPLLSQDGSAIGYSLQMRHGFWLIPLCFATAPGFERDYLIRFVFDHDDKLIRCDRVDVDTDLGGLSLFPSMPDRSGAYFKMNETPPTILPRSRRWWFRTVSPFNLITPEQHPTTTRWRQDATPPTP